MKKKLFATFGPIICATILLAIFLFAPFKIDLDSTKVLKSASTSMGTNVLRGNAIKNKALASKEYIPFLGSSELSRISPFHPSVLAEKYHRNYQPFLLGAPGTQSLTQSFMIQSADGNLRHKKVVFILSPQWFVKGGIKNDYFNAYYSELQIYQWITKLEKVHEKDVYLANRLMDFPKVRKNDYLIRILKEIREYKIPSNSELSYMRLKLNMLSREDELFGKIGMISKENKVKSQTKKLPNQYNEAELYRLAGKIGKKSTTNNSFEIDNHFYTTRLKKKIKTFRGAQKHIDYRYSPEYSDFQLALNQLADERAEVLFILPPVNKEWSTYTGLSEKMLRGFAKKVRYQLEDQGFTNIADFTGQVDIPYFMADTIHLGWRGWLVADQWIAPFLKEKPISPPKYKLNSQFFTKNWQQMNPDEIKGEYK